LGNLATPKSVQKLQMALHAKAKAEAGYRFYALYDKISREDILAHADAQCRSNKGAPGVDGQDFADIAAYGVERWLGELALALRIREANDEYDTYADKAYQMLIHAGAAASAIAAYLLKIATERMGLSDHGWLAKRCDHVAELLVSLRSELETH
jgi:hypothetical protein